MDCLFNFCCLVVGLVGLGFSLTIRDVSFFLCAWGGCNFPAEAVSKNSPPCRIHLKFCPPPLEDEGYSVVSSIGYAVTVGHCVA